MWKATEKKFIIFFSNDHVQTWPPRHRQQTVIVIWLSHNHDVTEQRSGCPYSIWNSKQSAVLKVSVQVMHKHTLTCSTGSNSWALHTCWHPLDISKHESELSPDLVTLKGRKHLKFSLLPWLEVNWPIPSIPALSRLRFLSFHVNRSLFVWVARSCGRQMPQIFSEEADT